MSEVGKVRLHEQCFSNQNSNSKREVVNVLLSSQKG